MEVASLGLWILGTGLFGVCSTQPWGEGVVTQYDIENTDVTGKVMIIFNQNGMLNGQWKVWSCYSTV